MSKHHQASRRRSYGRRQHELHERLPVLVEGQEPATRDDPMELGARVAAERRGGQLVAFGYPD